ncbi:Hypothetical predicted protein [Lecanosticta acicola]|uniref:Uncharacterized protein n=1 Tax=Lecanosticta acicola TaxID=111012 RepID=A0AAI8Z6B1_9PEZI|nr:Hypothetical predicted protein [Lecanosticta acicola]
MEASSSDIKLCAAELRFASTSTTLVPSIIPPEHATTCNDKSETRTTLENRLERFAEQVMGASGVRAYLANHGRLYRDYRELPKLAAEGDTTGFDANLRSIRLAVRYQLGLNLDNGST